MQGSYEIFVEIQWKKGRPRIVFHLRKRENLKWRKHSVECREKWKLGFSEVVKILLQRTFKIDKNFIKRFNKTIEYSNLSPITFRLDQTIQNHSLGNPGEKTCIQFFFELKTKFRKEIKFLIYSLFENGKFPTDMIYVRCMCHSLYKIVSLTVNNLKI